METKRIFLNPESRAEFHNQVDFCVGTGRMGLALHKEYQDQLKLVQDAIGFQHIRGHGLFCDDMAIYQVAEDGSAEYNFTYVDRVMDSYRAVGLKPFLELGFMPEKMASGTQTVFYWKGNTTPPEDYEKWNHMVQALLRHFCERYGEAEVLTWPIEVWNEPNLPGFWEHADMQEYFKLFHNTFNAIKEVNPKFRVGGPAVCGGSDEIWIKGFMQYCHDNRIPVDFVTRQGTHVESLIQVCYDMTSERTLKREVDSLVECAGELKCSQLLIVTMSEERIIEKNGLEIKVVPIHKF